MRPSIVSLAHLSLLLPFVSSTSLTLTIPPSTLLPNPATLPPSTHAILTSSNHSSSALLTRDGSFTFSHIPAGSYLCDIYTRDYIVVPMRVDVELSPEEQAKDNIRLGWEQGDIAVWQTFRGNEWGNKGELLGREKGMLGVVIRVLGEKKFYEERSGFSVLGLLQNPMILIGIVGLGVMIGMPKLMENMDPEMREEFEKQQASNPLTSAITGGGASGFDMAAWMAGSGSKGESAPEGQSGEAVKGGGNGGGKSKKR